MRTASGLEPINLQILRRTQVMPFSFLVLSAAALWIAVLASSGSVRSELLGVAVTLTVYAVIAAIALMVAGEEGRWLRLDEEGITVRGDRIPWEAVMSARWASTPPGRDPTEASSSFSVTSARISRLDRGAFRSPQRPSTSPRTCYST